MNRRKWLRRLVVVVSLGALGGGFVYRNRREPRAPTEIFKGITYGCERLEATEEGSGLLHWARIDLTAPGIELYVTPLDPSAVAQGWQYRLRHIKDIVDREHLAIAVNATLFTSNSGWRPRMSGDLANGGGETVVADHVVSHVWEHTYLLWFDDQLMPHLRPSKPPSAAELAIAKWGIGGQGVGLQDGKVSLGSTSPDSRTAVAVDRQRKLLFLAVGEYISPRLVLQTLADLGAKDGMLLDGGDSSSMVLGKDAAGVSAGVLYGGWRPVATYFGVRAKPLRAGE
jgi:Phosphodiester glycosidase